ncbi:plant intracellular Ras-group-related LRR protein 8 [Oryza brachyantha]|uniref:Ubiquitin-like domain-containing protein n=1 Tax=Oryza brachyantha TaxID=4533 RepID=J3N345_ORYBR|nr:plant intracellular Ras-group-related LRR protein 8 [Oryza brachyantha]
MESSPPPPRAITVQVKFGGRTIPVEVPASASVADLKRLLQPLTNVLPRGQRLICKGKVLADAASLCSVQVGDGSKVMLIASQGLHQGDGPITKNSSAPAPRRASNVKEAQPQKSDTNVSKIRPERWKSTGIIALSDSSLKAVPEEVWGCGSSIRVLDISNNSVEAIPQEIAALKSLQKLILTANDIADGNISWEGLICIQTLTVLLLSQNRLVALPSSLGSMTHLRELRIANNRLETLPVEIGLLKHLEILIASNNRISSLPSSIGDCESLNEVDLSSNLLAELPEAFGNLQNLKVLSLRNNGLTSLPSAFFTKCRLLITLDLHGTEITNDVLRQVDGWEEFDERRRKKHQKQLDFRVGSSGVFDEGADDDRRRS